MRLLIVSLTLGAFASPAAAQKDRASFPVCVFGLEPVHSKFSPQFRWVDSPHQKEPIEHDSLTSWKPDMFVALRATAKDPGLR